MEIRKLESEDVRGMMENDKCTIYLVDGAEKYLEELFERYAVKETFWGKLEGLLSDAEEQVSGRSGRKKRSVFIHGHELPVYPYHRFCEIDEEACLIILNDYYKETYKKLAALEQDSQRKHALVYFFADRETELDLFYREKYQDSPLEDLIVFRSGPHASSYVKGMDYGDNAAALFEYLLRKGYNRRYELVWLVKDPAAFSGITEAYENVKFLSFDWSVSERKEERDAYYRALCLAKYIFMTDAYGFCRNARKDQVRVQLWHGCGFKTRVRFVRCEERYEYTVVISETYKRIHSELYGLREEQVLVTGYPKNDWLYHPDSEWREKLGVPAAGHYVFWLPTFRRPVGQLLELQEKQPEGETGLPVVHRVEELRELNALLRKRDTVLVVKLHPFQDAESIYAEGMTNIVLLTNEMLAKRGLQVNQILGAAEALISDYSSAAVDYLLLDRPVGFTLDDVEEYEKSRGFVFEPIEEWLPGEKIYSFQDFARFLGEVLDGKDCAGEKRRKLRKKLHGFFDDESSRRVAETLKI